MSTDLIPFDAKGMPAHLQTLFADDEANLAQRTSINQLSFKGKTFRTIIDGKETPLMRPDPDNPTDMVPAQVINIVILDQNRKRSRAFYPGNFEEGKNAAPTCFSGDGEKPDASIKEPCAATCAACPNSVKGSKISDTSGAKLTACSVNKRIAVVPAGTIATHVPLLMRIPQTSMWDAANAHAGAGWYAYDQYVDMLRQRGVKHTGLVQTRVKFDSALAYPKLLFSVGGWLGLDDGAAVKQKIAAAREEIDGILNGKQSDDGLSGHPVDSEEQFESPAALAAPAVDHAAVAAQAAEAAAAEAAKKAAAAKAKKKADLLAAAAALDAEADEPVPAGGFDAEPAPVPAKAAAPTPAPAPSPSPAAATEVVTGTPAALMDLMNNWDK